MRRISPTPWQIGPSPAEAADVTADADNDLQDRAPSEVAGSGLSAARAPKASSKPLNWRAFAALIFLPALWYAFLVFQYGVNIPHFDQWTAMAPVFESMESGKLGFHDFAVQYNEHRLTLPRFVFFTLARLTHWNTRAEMVLTWLAFLGAAACLWKLLGATGGRANPACYAIFAVLGLLVFDPLQEQNIIDGFNFHFIVPIAFILAAYVAALTLRPSARFVFSAGLASAATFSMAVGLGAWGLIFPLLFLRERAPGWKKWMIAWGAVFALNLICYFIGYRLRAGTLGGVLQHPGAALSYFLVYLGAPFAWGTALERTDVACVVGAGLLGSIGVAVGILWRQRADIVLLRRAVPWLLVSSIALLHGGLAAMGRFQLGASQALETRYVPYAVMAPIGLFVLGWLLDERMAHRGIPWPRPILVALGSMLLLLHGLTVFVRMDAWPLLKHYRLMNKAVVQTIDVVDESEFYGRVTPETPRLRASIHALARLGYLSPPPLHSRSIGEIADAKSPGDPRFGALQASAQDDGQLALTGWAVLPDRLEPADAVLLTCDDAQGIPGIIALVEVLDKRADVVAATGEPGFYRSGWRRIVPIGQLPAGGVVKAWAYDAERRRAWRLTGAAVVRAGKMTKPE
jgi:hypothetical protein